MTTPEPGPEVVLVAADCPHHFAATTWRLAERLARRGVRPVFAVTTPYYERFKGVRFADLGAVHYLSDFIAGCPDSRVADIALDYWLTHATYTRTRYFWGRHINSWHTYRKVVAFFRDLFDAHPGARLVWSEIPSNSVLCIAHAEAERRGIPYFGYISARVPDHFNVATDLFATTLIENPSPPSRASSAPPDYMKNTLATLARRSTLSLFEAAPRSLRRALGSGSERSVEAGDTRSLQIRAARRQLARKLYYRFLLPRRLFAPPPRPERDGRAIVFPLQYRPEASTSVHARYHEHDLQTLRNIAFSLPHRTVLYVKEHPSAIGIRSRRFYRELLSFPSVRLLDIEPPLAAILERFDGMVCLTSTAGFEAIQRGLPVLLLGRAFYETYPGVTRIESWSQLPGALARLATAGPPRPSEEPMRRYLRSCFPGTFNYSSADILTDRNIELLAEPILRRLDRGVSD